MIGPQLPRSSKRKLDCLVRTEEPLRKRQKTNSEEEKDTRDLMHERNIYRYSAPNYYQLSLQYPFFRDVLKQNDETGEYYINYKDPKANIMLTKVLLKHDFALEFEHPLNHLCPAVTQRLNYILWIQDLLQCVECNMKFSKGNDNETKQYHGFDIGVGASCIFPLLGIKVGHKQNELWSFTASDIDLHSVKCAKNNIEINNLHQNITILHQTNPQHIFKGIIDPNEDFLFDFTVCNPPFFEHQQEINNSSNICTNATHSELLCKDGEIGFIQLIIDEIHELKLYHKIHWFTTMLGKKSSIKPIKRILNKSFAFVTSTTFIQGKQMRYGLAWSYNMNIKNNYHLLYKSPEKEKQTKNEFIFDLMVQNDANYNKCVMQEVERWLKRYGIKYVSKQNDHDWIEIDDIDINGFTFSMKWIIKPKKDKDKMILCVLVSIRYHDGDQQLFNGFVKWFRKQLN